MATSILMVAAQEIQAKLDNVPRRMRNSRAATGESLLRPLCRERVRRSFWTLKRCSIMRNIHTVLSQLR